MWSGRSRRGLLLSSLLLTGCGPNLEGLGGLWEWNWTNDGSPTSQNVILDASDREVIVKSCDDELFVEGEKSHRWERHGNQLVNPGSGDVADGESEAVIVNDDHIQSPFQCDDCWQACQIDADVDECPKGRVEKSEEKCMRITH